MAASKVWQCSTSSVPSIMLWRAYTEMCRLIDTILTWMYTLYFWCMGKLFESQITDIYFYNLETQERIRVLNQSNVFWVMFLMLLKTVFQITYHWSGQSMPLPIHNGFFEFYYYSQGKWIQWLSRDYDDTVEAAYSKTGSYLYASVNGCMNITSFVNAFIGSFNAHNKITSDELAVIARMKYGGVPVIYPATTLLMEDDTLDEKEFTGEDAIILCN